MSALFSRKPKQQPSRRDIARQRQDSVENPSSHNKEYTFRRNYTITGSASSSVSTLNEEGSQLKSSRVQAHDLTKQRRHIGTLFMTSLVACVGLFFLVTQITANVSITINGDVSIAQKADYSETIESYYNRSPLERLRFVSNQENLERYVKAEHPEVETIEMSRGDSIGVSHVAISTRNPVASWDINGQGTYVDRHGVNFLVNYYENPSVKIVDKSGIRSSSGETIASNSFLGFVGKVVGNMVNAQGLEVSQIVIPLETTRQIEVRVKGVKYPVKFSTDRPAGEQAEDAARALKWLRGHGNPRLDYLDVRVSGRAFYR